MSLHYFSGTRADENHQKTITKAITTGLKGNFVQLEDGPTAVTGDNPSTNATFPMDGKGRRWGRTIRKSEDLPENFCSPSWTVG